MTTGATDFTLSSSTSWSFIGDISCATGVRSMTTGQLNTPCGPAEGQWASHPMSELVLHINREVIHHGAEIDRLRDLYAHINQKKESH
jgi:hypothetical protein